MAEDFAKETVIRSRWFYFPLVAPLATAVGVVFAMDRFPGAVRGIGAVVLLVGVVANLLSFGTYYVESKRLRATDSGWTPNWILYVVTNLLILPVFTNLIYTVQRWRYIGLSTAVNTADLPEKGNPFAPHADSKRARYAELVAAALYLLGAGIAVTVFVLFGFRWLTLDPSLRGSPSVVSSESFYLSVALGGFGIFGILGAPYALVVLAENISGESREWVALGVASVFLILAVILWQYANVLPFWPHIGVIIIFTAVSIGLPAIRAANQ